ncbi:PREDICTED: melanoma-associated antigen B10-like [Chrysochloris asiatica]|uniref:Melanoma-associated antigen B10-like n=1 Tax=Chrysochloris asiatica TaxID=185453 RepID=A0A9B0T520_CHRAS|nr:PREDICTED: melanoma-associated antigen B10-like [Chrysochloris asiatica]
MPRGQKSKLRAREKRRQAREDNQAMENVLDTAADGEESTSSFSPHSEDPTASPPQDSQSVPCTSTSEAADEGASYQGKESPSSRKGNSIIERWQKGPLSKKVVVLVHYLLYKYQVKEPVTKAEILRNIIQMYKNQFPEILRKASEHLELIFGLDVKEVDPIRHTYVLVNKLESSYSGKISDDIGVPKTGILMTVLGVIFSNDNCAKEEQVWEVLNMMGLYAGRKHFIFGEPKKLLTIDLVKQKYLEYRQVPNSDPPCYEFLWGSQAYAETSKMKVLEFLAKIHDSDPSAFPRCLEEAVKEEEERAQARAQARARNTSAASTCSKAPSSF